MIDTHRLLTILVYDLGQKDALIDPWWGFGDAPAGCAQTIEGIDIDSLYWLRQISWVLVVVQIVIIDIVGYGLLHWMLSSRECDYKLHWRGFKADHLIGAWWLMVTV